MEQKKWWDNPTAAVGALMGDKAQKEAEERLKKKLQAEYQRGYENGKESAVVHAHPVQKDKVFGFKNCSACNATLQTGDRYCWYCGAKMDEVQYE